MLDVEAGAFGVGGGLGFSKIVLVRDGTILGEATGGTPTAMGKAVGDRPVQSCPIRSGLASGDYGEELVVAVGRIHSENIRSAFTVVISPNLARASMSIFLESPTIEISLGRG